MTAGGPCVFTLRVKIVEMANCGEWRKLKGRQPRRGVVGEGAATVGYFQDFEHGGVHQPLGVPSFSFPSLAFKVGLLKSSKGVWGSAVSFPSGVWGGAPAEIELGAF